MSPTSRNVLLIGGALILIALLLLFGPFKDLTGVGEMGVEGAPPVAAGPPQETEIVEPADTMDAIVAGALVGVSVIETDVAVRDATDKPSTADKADSPAPPPVANTPLRVEPRAVEEKKSSPSVSAGVPEQNVAEDGTIPGRDPIEEAIENFDAAFTMAGVGPEVDRFPPPVAIDQDEIALAILKPSPRSILQPCDLPGSGCLSSGPIEVGPDRSGGGIGRFGSGSPRGGTPSGEAF